MTIQVKPFLLLLLAAGVCVTTDTASVAGDSKPADFPVVFEEMDHAQLLENLQSTDRQVRRNAYRNLLQEHEELTKALMEIAQQQKKADEDELTFASKHELAIKLLSEFGCRDAIPIFIKHIDYPQAMDIDGPSFLNGYPCAFALRKIGHTSVRHIIYYLQVPEPDPVLAQRRIVDGLPPVEVSDKQIELFAWLFLDLYRLNNGGPKEAIRVVRGARDRASRKENLTRLLTMLETLTDPEKSTEFIKKTYRPED